MNSKILRTVILAAALSVCCCSCQKDNVEIHLRFKASGEAKVLEGINLKSGDSIVLDAGNGQVTARYFTVINDPEEHDSYWAAWCSWLRVIYYPHRSILYFSVSENTEGEQRKATVTATQDNGAVIYKVKQFR